MFHTSQLAPLTRRGFFHIKVALDTFFSNAQRALHWCSMDDGCHELPLPAGMTYEMLIPFTIAWRSTSTHLPWKRRAALVASHLQGMGLARVAAK